MYLQNNGEITQIISVRKEYNLELENGQPYIEVLCADGETIRKEYQTYNQLDDVYKDIMTAIIMGDNLYKLPEINEIALYKASRIRAEAYSESYCRWNETQILRVERENGI